MSPRHFYPKLQNSVDNKTRGRKPKTLNVNSQLKKYTVYQVSCNATTVVLKYIGFTVKPLEKMLRELKSNYNKYKKARMSREYLGVYTLFDTVVDLNIVEISTLEIITTRDRESVKIKTQSWIDYSDNCINENRALHTIDEKIAYLDQMNGIQVKCNICGKQQTKGNIDRHMISCRLR